MVDGTAAPPKCLGDEKLNSNTLYTTFKGLSRLIIPSVDSITLIMLMPWTRAFLLSPRV